MDTKLYDGRILLAGMVRMPKEILQSLKPKSQRQEMDTKLYDGRILLAGMVMMPCQRKFYNH
jgi:hypothetical protein